MSQASFQSHIADLRVVSTQVFSAVHRLPMEQKARYKELANQLALLESQAAVKPADEMLERAEQLLKTFRRFQSHLDTGSHAAA
jgi:hypothetical protein